jgi:5'-nucleotidase
MRVLICNDDGLASPGITLLARAAAAFASEVTVVAPARKWTAASHQISFDRDIALARRGERIYECDGAPADCVIAAMTVLTDAASRPDLVLSGINDKRNMAEDVAYSGTMAIAREATFWGVPSVALSRTERWPDTAPECAALSRLLAALWQTREAWAPAGHWLSLNLPATLPAPVAQARIGRDDKIGGASEVIERTPERIVYRLRRGRGGGCTAGDERSVTEAGAIAVVRHAWQQAAPLAQGLIEQWNED